PRRAAPPPRPPPPRDRGRAEAFAAAHGVERVLGSYAELLADPEVEVVYNPLANGLHGPYNLAAGAAGPRGRGGGAAGRQAAGGRRGGGGGPRAGA
ncbi:hypothetical protein ACWGJD_23660, partial [Streptomyces sp. NPDC054826]